MVAKIGLHRLSSISEAILGVSGCRDVSLQWFSSLMHCRSSMLSDAPLPLSRRASAFTGLKLEGKLYVKRGRIVMEQPFVLCCFWRLLNIALWLGSLITT